MALIVAGMSVAATPASASFDQRIDLRRLEQFVDQTVNDQLAEHNVAGAVVTVVKDRELVFSEGYGSADVVAGVPVDPEMTLFRIGSASKLFTATVVVQLVEEGRLDLDEDIRFYVDFEIPGDEPITLTHLLTHTAGFEDELIGYGEPPEAATPRREWMSQHVPKRVRPPGEYTAYSNYGFALAGYIAERVSDMPWEELVETRLLAPLGMSRSTPRWPVPDPLAGDLSSGHSLVDGELVTAEYAPITFAVGPTGMVSATGNDMARFMTAHLEGGALGESRILDAESVDSMQRRVFAHDERVNGIGYGFYEMSRNGVRIVGHGGDTELFHSLVALFPEQRLGIFVSYNSSTAFDGMSAIYEDLLAGFVDEFFPADATEPETRPGLARSVAGSYLTLRSNHTSVSKALGLVSTVQVVPVDDHTIDVVTPTATLRFAEVGPLAFQSPDGDVLVFEESSDSTATHAFLNSDPTQAFERLPWYQSPTLHLMVLQIGLLALASVPLIAAGEWTVNRARRRRFERSPGERRARWILLVDGLLALLLIAAYAAVDVDALLAGRTTSLVLVPVVAVGIVLLTVAAGVSSVNAWRQRFWGLPGRIHYTAVTLVAAVFLWSAHTWNLTG